MEYLLGILILSNIYSFHGQTIQETSNYILIGCPVLDIPKV